MQLGSTGLTTGFVPRRDRSKPGKALSYPAISQVYWAEHRSQWSADEERAASTSASRQSRSVSAYVGQDQVSADAVIGVALSDRPHPVFTRLSHTSSWPAWHAERHERAVKKTADHIASDEDSRSKTVVVTVNGGAREAGKRMDLPR